jgi:AraC family transcriptional regulator
MKAKQKRASPSPVTPAERERLKAAMRLIERPAARRPRGADLAKGAGMSLWHFHRRFSAYFGETPLQAAARVQVEEAKRRMLAGAPLAEVARRVGFTSQSHFTNRFRQLTGETPAAWLRAHKKASP